MTTMGEDSFWKHSLRFLFEIWDELSGIVSPLKSVATSVVVLVVGCIVALYVRRKYQKVEKVPPPGVLGMEVLETVRPFASVTCIRTDAMFQDEMSALKAVASPNICFIVVSDGRSFVLTGRGRSRLPRDIRRDCRRHGGCRYAQHACRRRRWLLKLPRARVHGGALRCMALESRSH